MLVEIHSLVLDNNITYLKVGCAKLRLLNVASNLENALKKYFMLMQIGKCKPKINSYLVFF